MRSAILSAVVTAVISWQLPGGELTQRSAYYDGGRRIAIFLEPGFVVQGREDGQLRIVVRPETDERPAKAVDALVVGEGEVEPEIPVFRDSGGNLMAAVGGVVLVLDPMWESDRVAGFLRSHGLTDRSKPLEWLRNGFLVSTKPGMASLDLANDLVGEPGVEISMPNWMVELEEM